MGYKSIPLLIALLGMSLSFGAWAQSQTGGQSIPYDMDEECYRLYQEGSTLVGKPGFQEVNEQLYRVAVQKEDRRGKVFYYINRHRDVTRQPWETPAFPPTRPMPSSTVLPSLTILCRERAWALVFAGKLSEGWVAGCSWIQTIRKVPVLCLSFHSHRRLQTANKITIFV